MKRISLALPVLLLLWLVLAACEEDKEDYSISEITIYNIPANIPLLDNKDVSLPVYKIYLNASNSQSENERPAAKGVANFSEGTLENGKYTITIHLQKPNAPEQENPNEVTGSWTGTARFFSVMISPQDVSVHGVKTVWIKAGTTLDKSKSRCDWTGLMDFRALIESDPEDEMEFAVKSNALYTDIVLKDPEINRP